MDTSTLSSFNGGNHIASMDSESLGILESETPPIDLPNCNAWKYLDPFFTKWSHLTALICGMTSKSYTYKQIYEASLRWAKELQSHFQDKKPPVVSIICPNTLEYPILYLGCLAIGAPLCPVRHDYEEGLILHMLKETQTTVVVVHPSVLEKCRNILAKLDREFKVYVAGPGPINPGDKNLFQVLFSNAEMLKVETAKQTDPESISLIAFSSGTTGIPKGILISQKAHVNDIACFTHPSVFPIKTADDSFQDTLLYRLPLAHNYGLLFTSLAIIHTGCQTIMCDPFDMSNILPTMEKFKPRVLHVNPFVIDNLCRMSNYGTAFENARVIMTVGSPHNPVTFRELNEKTNKKLVLHEGYGATEIGMGISTPVKYLGHTEATGKPVPNTKVRLLDINTGEAILEPHKHGEIFIQCPSFMNGYLNNPEATKETLVDGKWFRSGDIGYYDEDHFIYVLERAKDAITVDGKQVLPSSIEKVLKKHNSVVDVAVIGSPNMKAGIEEAKAFVIRNGPVKESDLIKFVEENAPPQLWLRGGVAFVDSLPRNPLGKLIRKHLRTMAWVDADAVSKTKNY